MTVCGPTASLERELCEKDLAFDVEKGPKDTAPVGSKSRCPRMVVKVSGHQVKCLLDSGSNITCISELCYQKMIKITYVRTLPITNLFISGAFGKKSQRVKKQTLITLEMGPIDIDTVLVVVQDLSHEIIIGSDWLSVNNAIIDYDNKQFRVKGQIIPGVSFTEDIPLCYNSVKSIIINELPMTVERYPPTHENDANGFLEAGDSACSFSRPSEEFSKQIEDSLQKVTILNAAEKIRLRELIEEFHDIFSDDPGCMRNYEYEIKLTDPNPNIRSTYPIPIAQTDQVDDAIVRMLRQKIIERAKSSFCNPIRVIVKKNKKIRLCLDAQKMNRYIQADQESPPLIEEVIQDHEGAMFFTSTDFTEGYYQIKLSVNSRKYTAFMIKGVLYQFCRVPFGIKVAGCVFMRALRLLFDNRIFSKFLTLFVDDALIKSRTFDEHLEHLRLFWEKIREAGLTLKLEKTLFCREEIPFLGFILSKNGVSPDPERVEAIMKLPEPRNHKELQSFVGMCTYYRRFYDRFAQFIDPLRNLLSSKNKFEWTTAESQAFVDLKNKLSEYILLSHYRRDVPFCIQTDGSKQAISAVLFQFGDDGKQNIIAVVSRCLTSYERNYTATEVELLAIIYAVIKLRRYLLGKTFKIITDHKALIFLLKTTYYTSRLMRWILVLQNYDYKIVHCKGEDNVMADYFSRISPNNVEIDASDFPVNDSVTCDSPIRLIAAVKTLDLWIPELRHISILQRDDRDLMKLRENITEKNLVGYQVANDIIFSKKRGANKWCIVIPGKIQNKLIQEAHERFGHIGVYKTFSLLNTYFWWKGMRKMVKKYVTCCDLCQRIKHPNKNMTGAYLQVAATRPNELVAVDFYGPLPRSTGGVEYILVVLDVFSRLVTLYPLKKATATASVNRMREYFEKIGKPSRVLSDHGTQYTSGAWRAFLAENNVDAVYCSIRHPQSNPSERVMRELGKLFRAYCSERHTAWATHIKHMNVMLNATTHCVTGYTPYELHFGKSPVSKIKSLISFPPETRDPQEIKVELANKRTRKAHEQRKHRQRPSNIPPLKVDSLVLVRVPKQSSALEKKIAKFFHIYYGPYRVGRIFNDNAYELVDVDRPREVIGHYNRTDLKIYRQSN